MIERFGARAIALVVFAIFLVGLVLFGVSQCQKRQSLGSQSRVERSQAGAASNSAADAIGTVARSGEATAASEDLTRANERNIRNADGASEAVKPAARDAGISALCERKAYASDPRCRRP